MRCAFRIRILRATWSLALPLCAAHMTNGQSLYLDPLFADNGTYVHDAQLQTVALTSCWATDGGVLMAGWSAEYFTGMSAIAVWRFGADGQLDPAFGTVGDGRSVFDVSPQYLEGIRDMVALDDGRYLLAGYVNTDSTGNDMLLFMLNPDGQPDLTWGDDGRVFVTAQFSQDMAYCATVDNTGRAVAGGDAHWGALVARRLPDGSPDPSFMGVGQELYPFGDHDVLNAVRLLPDGRLLFAGTTTGLGDRSPLLLMLDPDGSMNSAFGNGGSAVLDIGAPTEVMDMTVDEQGRILLAGKRTEGFTQQAALIRCTPDGQLDTTWSADGAVTYGDPSEFNVFNAVMTDGPDRVVAGGTLDLGNGPIAFAMVGYLPNGTMDSGWGDAAVVHTGFPGITEGAMYDLDRSSDGRVLASGTCMGSDLSQKACIARYDWRSVGMDEPGPSQTAFLLDASRTGARFWMADPRSAEPLRIQVMDISGRVMGTWTRQVQGSQIVELEWPALSAGVHVLSIRGEQGAANLRFVAP